MSRPIDSSQLLSPRENGISIQLAETALFADIVLVKFTVLKYMNHQISASEILYTFDYITNNQFHRRLPKLYQGLRRHYARYTTLQFTLAHDHKSDISTCF